VVFNLGVATPWGLFAFFVGVARAFRKSIHDYFNILYFVYQVTFGRSQNDRITWQK